jgi:hypothetical protein
MHRRIQGVLVLAAVVAAATSCTGAGRDVDLDSLAGTPLDLAK